MDITTGPKEDLHVVTSKTWLVIHVGSAVMIESVAFVAIKCVPKCIKVLAIYTPTIPRSSHTYQDLPDLLVCCFNKRIQHNVDN